MDGPLLIQLSNDLAEKDDRSSSDPDRLENLRSAYEAWSEGNLKPIFPSYREYHQTKRKCYQGLK